VKVDLCVIGGGSGGLSVAAGASQMGSSVLLFEGGKMGGDCLNYGCVPSKALLAAGKAAHHQTHTAAFGITPVETPEVDFGKVRDHVRDVIGGIAPHDSVERFESLGVRVIEAFAKFVGPRTVEGGGVRVEARRFVIATGSGPLVPPIAGLADTPYFTNETIFENGERPEHLIVVGGGPIGTEMAQAHRRLGSQATILEMASILPHDDPDLVAVLRERLTAEGVSIREGVKVVGVAKSASGVTVTIETAKGEEKIDGSHLLIAAGRKPNLDKLDLEAAGIEYDRRGVKVGDDLVSTNRKVFAIGDAAGRQQFTHVAGWHAGVVVRNALFQMRWAKAKDHAVPWVTYSDPELAHVGLTEKKAREQFGESVSSVVWKFEENDRARAERRTEGVIKVVVRKGKPIGASIVGLNAGDLIYPWVMAVQNGMKMAQIAASIAPYPTLSEVSKRAVGAYFTPSLFSDRTRKVVRLLAKLG
ncbi:MAG: FAD-dependent oxidoreductase, partial [Pseudomonadota bacterium]